MLFALWALIQNPSDLSLLIGLGSWLLVPYSSPNRRYSSKEQQHPWFTNRGIFIAMTWIISFFITQTTATPGILTS
jgi:hypothetical protein